MIKSHLRLRLSHARSISAPFSDLGASNHGALGSSIINPVSADYNEDRLVHHLSERNVSGWRARFFIEEIRSF